MITKLKTTFLTGAFLLLAMTACSDNSTQNTTSAPATTNKTKETAMNPTVTAIIKTNKGDITLELDREKAPLTVANFIKYAESGHYKDTLFHRVIPGFMIQGGGFVSGMQQKPTKPSIMNEASNGLKNTKYSISMARTSEPHSATSQFFINTNDNVSLDFTSESPSGWGYAVFGKVTAGQQVVDDIEIVTTMQRGPYGDVPYDDVVIEDVVIDGE